MQPKSNPQQNPESSKLIRLNKFLAERLGVSRREADDLIAAGKITINGHPATLGNQVDKNDKICYNNEPVPQKITYSYYAFNKPVGYVCSRHHQSDTPTIYDILPEELRHFKNVGRLDRMSSGLLLLTNDGDFAFQMTHPKFIKQKVYEVTLHKPLLPQDLRRISEDGVLISDGLSKFQVSYNPHPSVTDLPKKQRDILHARMQSRPSKNDQPAPDGLHLIVSLSEGRNRQIRRTFGALGYNVLRLHRTKFGPYDLGDLPPGHYLEIQK